jgi:hypothetical protein
MTTRRALILSLLVSGAAVAAMQPAPGAMPRFTWQRPVATLGAGPQRIAIDQTLLEGAKPFRVVKYGDGALALDGLADLRLFAGDRELPYLLISPLSREPSWTGGPLLAVAATKKTSGFEIDLRRAESVDRVRVDGIPAPFLKRFLLEGSGDRAHWTMLSGEGTLFDLPEEGVRQTEVAIPRGTYRYLRFTWDDTNSGRVPLPRAVLARRAEGPPRAAAASDPLQVERRPSEPGRSRYRVRLPVARLPAVALAIEVANDHVFRAAVVTESRFSGTEAIPAVLGSARLVRVSREGAAAESLRIPIAPPMESELQLLIEDGDNPPLEITKVSAVLADLPWIYVDAPADHVVAKYGDPRATAPRYDLEAARNSIDLAGLREAAWGKPTALVPAEPPTAAPPPMAGATIDPAGFRYSRTLTAGGAGLVALPLDAAVSSHSAGPSARFADVRIVDSSQRQIPYLLERRDEPLAIDVRVSPAAADQSAVVRSGSGVNRSVYVATLPYPNLPGASLVLETPARVFNRDVRLGVLREPDRQHRERWFDPIASITWRHTESTTAAPALTFQNVIAGDARELLLVVDEGDNAALPIGAARLLLPGYRVRFFRPSSEEVRLVYGRRDLAPPQYDLALLAPQVMGAAAAEIAASPEPQESAGAAPFISPRWFWIIITAAVLALLVIIARLVRT